MLAVRLPALRRPKRWADDGQVHSAHQRRAMAKATMDAADDLLFRLYSLRRERVAGGMRGPYMYFVEGATTGLVKIGFAAHVGERVASLQTGCAEELRLVAAVSGTKAIEREAHKIFVGFRVIGEWFRREGALDLFIASLGREVR